MSRVVLWAFAVYYLLTGLYIAIAPLDFYLSAPGVEATGPYNMHFIRDVGFAFTVCALALGYGLYRRDKAVLVFGALWLFVHGLFHLALWLLHGMHLDGPALIDAVLVSVPAIVLFVLCLRFRPAGD